MDNKKDDSYYLKKIEKDIDYIEKKMKGVSLEDLNEDETLLDSMMFRMIQISENSKKLSEQYRANQSKVPWGLLFGMRNRLVHDYGNVNLVLVYYTLTHDIPSVREILFEKEGR